MQHTPPSVADSWHTVHQLLLAHDWEARPTPERVDFAVYAYCVYKAFGRQNDADLAYRFLAELAAERSWQRAVEWPAPQLEQACRTAGEALRIAAFVRRTSDQSLTRPTTLMKFPVDG